VTTVLVVDPDQDSRRLTANLLRHYGYDVATAGRPERAGSLLRLRPADALIIDPVADNDAASEALLRELRPRTEIPILVMAARAANGRLVRLLDAGADDCLAKPVDVEELLARLRVALRRSRPQVDLPPVRTEHFALDVAERRASRPDGTDVRLTPIEWKLVEVLTRHRGHLVTQAELLQTVWGARGAGRTAYLRVHMTTIRHKLEPEPARPRYFLTVPGVGLRFLPDGNRPHE